MLAPFMQCLSGALIVTILALATEGPLDWQLLSWKAWLSAAGLGVFASALAAMLYFRIVRIYGATSLSMSTFLMPIYGGVIGVLFLGETLSLPLLLGGGLIIWGIKRMLG